jgi:hypothetical protein
MRTVGLVKLVVGLVSVLVGCTPLFNSSRNVTPPLKADAASSETLQPLSALGDRCSAPILEPERSALLQEALADSFSSKRSKLTWNAVGWASIPTKRKPFN